MKTKKKQTRRRKGIRGSISVFLVIILVPCICITSIFVDVSRVQMSKGIATSAADVTLNSLMSYYDYDLSDIYGLMASCQNIEDYYAVADAYFMRMLSSQDLTEDEVSYIADQYEYKVLEDAQISDLMRLENKSEGGMTGGISGANLANPTILKDQIVEFMKYRAPIVVVEEIVERIKTSPGIEKIVGDGMAENKPLVDSKEDFYEAEGEFNKAAFNTYWAIRDYYEEADSQDMTVEKLKEYQTMLEHYREVYKEIHTLMVKNLYNTSEYNSAPYNRPTYSKSTYTYVYTGDEMKAYVNKFEPTAPPSPVYTAPPAPVLPTPTVPAPTEEEPNPTAPPTFTPAPPPTAPPAPVYTKPPVEYTVTNDGHNKLINEAKQIYLEFIEEIRCIREYNSSLIDTPAGENDNDAYKIQWWVQAYKNLDAVRDDSGDKIDLYDTADKLARVYAKLKCIQYVPSNSSSPPYTDPESGSSRVTRENTWITNINVAFSKYLTSGVQPTEGNGYDRYLQFVSNLEAYTSSTLSKTHLDELTVVVDGEPLGLTAALAHIKTEVETIKTNTQKLIDYLTIAIDGNESSWSVPKNSKVVAITKLVTLAENYNNTLNTWDYYATPTGDDMEKEDQEEIDKIRNPSEGDIEELSKLITAENINDLKKRLVGIKTQLEKVTAGINSLEYGEKAITEIDKYDTFKKRAKGTVKEEDITYLNQTLNAYVDSTFVDLFEPDTGDILKYNNMDDSIYNPLIDPVLRQYEVPDALNYLHNKFKDANRYTVKEKQDEVDGGKDFMKEQENAAKDADRYHGPDDRNITKSLSGDSKFSFGDSLLKSLYGLVKNLFNGDFDAIRDDLYVTTYIMNMFSYATFETEGMYGLVPDDEKTTLELPKEANKYYPSRYNQNDIKGAEDTEKTWLSTKLSDSYNKTLRNKMINESNNYAYLAEVEYLLYGGTNKSNVKAVYTNIYTLRYALNWVSGMLCFYSKSNPTANLFKNVARVISLATQGIVPAPLLKILFISIFTAFETGKDMDRLEAGFPVEIFKAEDSDWWYALTSEGSGNSVGDITGLFANADFGYKENPGTGLFYSDYLTLFVYLGLANDDFAETMYKRMAEVMQENIQMLTNNEEYSLEKSQVYFKLDAKLRVSPLMLTLPVLNEFDVNLDDAEDWNTYTISSVRGYP